MNAPRQQLGLYSLRPQALLDPLTTQLAPVPEYFLVAPPDLLQPQLRRRLPLLTVMVKLLLI